jgi:hypothetical protein
MKYNFKLIGQFQKIQWAIFAFSTILYFYFFLRFGIQFFDFFENTQRWTVFLINLILPIDIYKIITGILLFLGYLVFFEYIKQKGPIGPELSQNAEAFEAKSLKMWLHVIMSSHSLLNFVILLPLIIFLLKFGASRFHEILILMAL